MTADPVQTCEAMRGWALEEGLSEDSLEEEAFVECRFRGVIDSGFLSILVTPARNEIPTSGIDPILVGVEHEAVVAVEMYQT